MDDEDEDAKQRDPDRDGVGPGIETGPPSVVTLLRLGQGADSSGLPTAFTLTASGRALETQYASAIED